MFSLASVWRERSRAAALAACLVVAVPGFSLAQDGDLAARVKSLEAEIANLKVMMSTLVSLVRATPPSALESGFQTPPRDDLKPRLGALEAKNGALANELAHVSGQIERLKAKLEAAPPAPEPKDDVEPRLGKLESQTGALTNKIEEICAQLTTLTAAPQAAAPSAPHAATPKAETPPPQMSALTEEEEQVPAPEAAPQSVEQNVDPHARWYGPKPGEEDDGSPKSIMPPDVTTGALPDDMPQSFAALPDENAEALYKQGYGDYLRRDYTGAEKAFSQLVKAYPNDPLAGSAQYWVGETYYMRKQYQKAADTFLAGYRKYASGDRAPDSLLKLAMSLAALGDKEAACNTFDKLDDTLPDAAGDIRSQAKSERKKAGCR